MLLISLFYDWKNQYSKTGYFPQELTRTRTEMQTQIFFIVKCMLLPPNGAPHDPEKCLFNYWFVPQIFIEHLLCTRYLTSPLQSNSVQDRNYDYFKTLPPRWSWGRPTERIWYIIHKLKFHDQCFYKNKAGRYDKSHGIYFKLDDQGRSCWVGDA